MQPLLSKAFINKPIPMETSPRVAIEGLLETVFYAVRAEIL
jgi:hypothetical protein